MSFASDHKIPNFGSEEQINQSKAFFGDDYCGCPSCGNNVTIPVKSGHEPYGYHKTKIVKGVLGEASKISEEYAEFIDANEQKNSVMELVELSDLLGAIEAYTKKKYLINLDTLLTMTRATQRAFKTGLRK
jgi:hypothetical protein